MSYYNYDHLGNTRVVCHSVINCVSDSVHYVLEYAADYYPFGSILREWSNCEKSRFLFTYKERDAETGWDNLGALLYDSDIGRFFGVDVLEDRFLSWSTFSYTFDNPIRFTDPEGRAPVQPKDDYYDRKGNFLFRDSKKTDFIRIVDDKALNNVYPQILSHKPGTERKQFLEDYLGQSSNIVCEANISVEAWSKITTDILSKMDDVDASMLYNGSTSVIDRITGDKFNDPENVASLANTVVTKDGLIKITSTLYGGSADVHLSTVSNVQNALGAHEFQGHGIQGLGDKTKTHHKAYEHQFKHPSYKTITHSLRSELQSNYKYYLNREKN